MFLITLHIVKLIHRSLLDKYVFFDNEALLEFQGEAFSFPRSELGDEALFPHILTRY